MNEWHKKFLKHNASNISTTMECKHSKEAIKVLCAIQEIKKRKCLAQEIQLQLNAINTRKIAQHNLEKHDCKAWKRPTNQLKTIGRTQLESLRPRKNTKNRGREQGVHFFNMKPSTSKLCMKNILFI